MNNLNCKTQARTCKGVQRRKIRKKLPIEIFSLKD